MARKNLLAGLTGAELPAGNSADGKPELPAGNSMGPASLAARNDGFVSAISRSGAIGAVSRSIEQIRAQSVLELAPELIDSSFIEDRLGGSSDDLATLVVSMREHGQQVPILVRPHPDQAGRFQIAYGRRRLRAATELGRTVRAIVKPLTDEQLVVAQGQENNERKDLSFIERALFAAELEARGFAREIIMAAIGVDKTGLSRLISSAVRIPRDVIHAIGPAPKAGRDRWSDLAVALESTHAVNRARKAISAEEFAHKPSDDRFQLVYRAATTARSPAPRPTVMKSADGKKIALIRSDAARLSVIVDKRSQAEFAAYLMQEIPEIYARFLACADA